MALLFIDAPITPEHFNALDAFWPAPDPSRLGCPDSLPKRSVRRSCRHFLEDLIDELVGSAAAEMLIDQLDAIDGDPEKELNGDEAEHSEVPPLHGLQV